MNNYHVYLAGAITGYSYDECTDWRTEITKHLDPRIDALSPLRAKEYLKSETNMKSVYDFNVLSSQKGIMTRDFNDCKRSDVIIVNLSSTKRVSIGTVMELAWAFMSQTPVVCIMEDEGNVHEHPMVREAISYRVNHIIRAAEITNTLLFSNPCSREKMSRGRL